MAAAKISVGFPIMLWSVISIPDVRLAGRSFACIVQCIANPRRRATASVHTEDKGNNGTEMTPTNTADGARKPSNLRDSLAPAAFMGIAMVARGEIGLLIAQIARGGSSPSGDSVSAGDSLLGEEPFLVCLWAILLCTLMGPIGIGFIIRRWEMRIRGTIWG